MVPVSLDLKLLGEGAPDPQAKNAATTLMHWPGRPKTVAAYLEREAARYCGWFRAAVAATTTSPRDRILALFDPLIEQVRPDNCRGYPFQIGLAESPDSALPNPALPGHAHAIAVKDRALDQSHALTAELPGPSTRIDAAALVDHLMLVFDGVCASALSLGAAGLSVQVQPLVERLTNPNRQPDHRSWWPPVPSTARPCGLPLARWRPRRHRLRWSGPALRRDEVAALRPTVGSVTSG